MQPSNQLSPFMFIRRSKEGSFPSFLRETFFTFRQWRMWFLLGVVIAAYLINIKLAVALNDWNGRFYNALQVVNKEEIFSCLYDFILLCSAIILVLVTADYLQGRAALIARRELTHRFFNRWLSENAPFYCLRLENKEPDNPDQRIAEDIRDAVSVCLNLCTSFFNSVLMIGSFSVILWNLSGPLTLFGFSIPGYMFWVCLIYTFLETLITHLIGRKLKRLNFDSQKREADFRSSLLAKRTHAESIAGLKGTSVERLELNGKFSSLLNVLIEILRKKRNLEYFSVGTGQVTHLTPIFFSLPAFFAGTIELGGLMQIRGAFIDVARSLSWIAMSYQQLARFAATYERLSTLHYAIEEINEKHKQTVCYSTSTKGLKADFYLCIPERSQDERLKVKLTLKQGQLTVLQGPSGSGKSSILRVLAGFDRFASGMVESPSQKLWITQQPYLFKETLKANLTYPELPDKVSDSKALALLEKVGLGRLEPFLNHTVDWQHRLSGGEQQRLMLARMLLLKPQVLLLDEATSALDETTAEAMTEMLRLELKNSAILLVTHQSVLVRHADQVLQMKDFYVNTRKKRLCPVSQI